MNRRVFLKAALASAIIGPSLHELKGIAGRHCTVVVEDEFAHAWDVGIGSDTILLLHSYERYSLGEDDCF